MQPTEWGEVGAQAARALLAVYEAGGNDAN